MQIQEHAGKIMLVARPSKKVFLSKSMTKMMISSRSTLKVLKKKRSHRMTKKCRLGMSLSNKMNARTIM